MSAEVTSAYVQLFSAGLLWISLHCVGMCGPLVLALDVSQRRAGSTATQGVGHVVLYQLGRATTYAFLGSVAGMIGGGIKTISGPVGAIAVGVMGVVMLAAALWPRRTRRNPPTTLERRSLPNASSPPTRPVHRRVADGLLSAVGSVSKEPTRSRSYLLGVVLGLMPCMITFWVLGLAATTGSPLHGAVVMILLVALTTPVLVSASLLPRLLPRFRGHLLRRLLLAASGAWLMLIAGAGLGVVAHQHLGVALFGHHYMIMLW